MADVQNRISWVWVWVLTLSLIFSKQYLNEAIQKYGPTKQRYVRANQVPFISQTINKEIMKRSLRRNKFLNTISGIDRKTYNMQHNLCVSLIRRDKKNFNNISARDITDNKIF